MIGIIDCRSHNQHNHETTWAGAAPEMLEFFDRPLLQHAVEQMVQNGVIHCVLIVGDTAHAMERWGTGERWGCTLSALHPSELTSFLISHLTRLPAGSSDHRIMIGRGDCIPCLPRPSAPTTSRTQLIFREATLPVVSQLPPVPPVVATRRTRIFTGWAITDAQTLLTRCFPTQGADGLLHLPGTEAVQVALCIRSHSPGVFLHSQQLVLEAPEPSLIVLGVLVQPNVWAARNVSLHPSVKIVGNVYLGENARVGPGVTLIGPVVVGRDSIIDANASLSDTSIQPTTYVGRGMKLEHDIVLPHSILRAQQGISIPVHDPRRLADTTTTLRSYLRSLL